MPDQLQLRGGSTTEHNSFTGVIREVTVDTTKKTLVVHDGASAGGTALMKESGGNAASSVGIGTSGTNAINIDSSQKVGIGTANPATLLHLDASGGAVLRLQRISNNATNKLELSHDGTNGTIESTNATLFRNGGGSSMTIDSSGNVGIGTTNPNGFIHIEGTSTGAETYARFSTGAANGDQNLYIQSSSSRDHMALQVKTGAGVNDDLSLNPSGGNVGIGTTDPDGNRLKIKLTNNNANSFLIEGGDTQGRTIVKLKAANNTSGHSTSYRLINSSNATVGSFYFENNENDIKLANQIQDGNIQFQTNQSGNVESKMTIDASGNVGIGTTSPDHLLHCQAASAVAKFNHTATGDTTAIVMRHARGGLSGFNGKMISFLGNDSTEEGSIVIHTTTTAYNTSSDYRLKENEVAISDGITRLKQLKPYIFNFKKNPDVKVDGFFAHEVSSVVPIAVTGEKDAINDDGSIKPQGIDQSKLVPLLVAAVQELIGKVEALEAA